MSRIDELLEQMTFDEKVSMLAGADLWHSVGVPRFGIPQFKVTDGPNGARGAWGDMGAQSVATPVGIALGATWNPELIEKVGNVLADEVKAKGAHILLAPTVNIHRTPIAGRNFECFSEDPFLSGMIASAYIKGIQDKGAGACIKHFVANDQEYERHSMSSEVDERTLREIYLEPFRLAIRNAKPWAVMSAYNRVNGIYACENDHTLKDILKGEWGFEGIVMSDWFGTYDEDVPAGGLDLEMPGPGRWMAKEFVQKALDSGTLSMEALDDKVRRLLDVLEKAGLFENPELQPERGEDKPEHRSVLREAAREAIVLLKNENDLLPLQKPKSIAVIGPYARRAQILGGGSSSVSPHYSTSPFDGIQARAGDQVKVESATGCFIHKNLPSLAPETMFTSDERAGLTVSLFDNTDLSGEPVYSEVTSRTQFGWFEDTVPNVNQEAFSLRLEGFFMPQQSGTHTFGLNAVGLARLFIDEKLVIDHWAESEKGQQKMVELELTTNQGYPIRLEYSWKGNKRWRSVSLGHLPPHAPDLIAEAEDLAKRSDVVVLIASLTNEWESEGFDRVDMKLPGAQDELIERVAAANPNTVVVLNAGSAVEMPWIDKVPAVIQLWYDSQEQGNALSDVLFGDVNPSGKLPTTFPVRLQDNPAYINYPGENGKVRYGEGLFVGYRYYDKKELAPQFPFGHGLSYTTFEYSNLHLSEQQVRPVKGLDVSFDVTNTGKRAGKEVVQLYVRDLKCSVTRPEKELKAFAKIELAPGETKTVTLPLSQEAFWFFDTAQNGWITEPGEMEVLIGSSSREIRLKETFTLTSGTGSRLHIGLPLRELLEDEAGHSVLAQHFGGMLDTPMIQMGREMSLEQISEMVPETLTPGQLKAINDDLAKAS
ncbi:MAG TPA: glycoside hydrolase family 3 C-terminal domain-containing protein [Anaerolineales bacterium]|nr:glycoside hydrolase family 3 C-terminal domain-containing protein [Anaerolineales bacterium]